MVHTPADTCLVLEYLPGGIFHDVHLHQENDACWHSMLRDPNNFLNLMPGCLILER